MVQRIAVDSALDVAMLEKLRETHAPVPPGEPEVKSGDEEELGTTFDINVASYTEHQRVRYYLDFFQGSAHERMTIWLSRLPRYEPMIRSALQSAGVPGDLAYLGLIESGYSNTAVSRSRAVGMWQFMKGTARLYGLEVNSWVDERRDPVKATVTAARYLADLTAKFGSHYLAAAAYNGGPGRIQRGLARLKPAAAEEVDEEDEDSVSAPGDDNFFRLSDTRYLKRETKDYVPKLIAAAMIAKQPERYGFPRTPAVEPFAADSVTVPDVTSLEVISRVSGIPLANLVDLNQHYVRLVTPPGKPSLVRVPVGKGSEVAAALAGLTPAERVAAMSHVIRRRESFKGIAARYGLTRSQLLALNPGVPTVQLKPGAVLRIPGAARLKSWIAEDSRSRSARHARSGAKTAHRAPTTSDAAKPVSLGTRAASGTHLVRRGETITRVARRYGVSAEALMRANRLRSPRALQAGMRLKIPDPTPC